MSKNVVTLKSGSEVTQGHCKWYHSIDCVRFHVKCSIETLSLKRIVFDIFDFKNAMTLKTGSTVTQGHRKWYHSIDGIWFPISVL